MAKKIWKRVLDEENSTDTVKRYNRVWEEVPDKPASKKPPAKKAAPKKAPAKKAAAPKKAAPVKTEEE